MRKLTLDLDNKAGLVDSISQLDRDDARLLNKLIVEHLKSIREMSTAEHMAKFSVGDKVVFTDKYGLPQTATVLRLNRKTASLLTDDDERWNVPPQLLELQVAAEEPQLNLIPSDATATISKLPVNPSGTEWVGGILSIPGQINEEGSVFQPVGLAWMDQHGLVVHFDVSHPDTVLDELPHSLKTALGKLSSQGLAGPQRIRMDRADAIDVLQANFPQIQFQHGDTPELSELKDSMFNDLSPMGSDVTYLSSGASKQSISAMFGAAAKFYKASPWDAVPHDQCLIGVSIPSHNVHHAVISVIGQQQQSLGFLYFQSLFDYEQYLMTLDSIYRDIPAELPPYTALTFEPGNSIDDAQRKEISENQWKVANSKAYPDVFTPGSDRTRRPITQNDFALLEILCLSLPKLLRKVNSKTAWHSQSESQCVEVSVAALAGETNVEFHVPYLFEKVSKEAGQLSPLMAQLCAIGRAIDDVNWEVFEPVNDALIDGYRQSKERQQLGENPISISELLPILAANHMNATIATLQASELEEILYEILPRKVAVESSDAEDIIADVRAFYTYLKREHGLWLASSCLDVLQDDAKKTLAGALSDSNQHGMAKSLLSQAEAAGFNVQSADGLEQLMAAVNSGSFTPSMDSLPLGMPMGGNSPTEPAMPTVKPVDKKARKNKRKASRKARKKNR